MATAEEQRDPAPLLAALTVLAVVSGLVDAVCYLGLGHVFTANMTGNVVVLGFAAAGAPGFSVPATATSLGMFLIGALLGGRVARRIPGRSRLLLATALAETTLLTAATLVAALASTVATGWARYTVIAILALAMGARNAAVRELGVPDISTTVLTQTLTGLATDFKLAGGTGEHMGRRVAVVIAMLAGAVGGALIFLHSGPVVPLIIATALAAVTPAFCAWLDRLG